MRGRFPQDTSRTFDRQAVLLTQASADASAQAEKLTEKDQETRRDLFLKTARHIVEDLHSTSIDVTRMLNNDIPDADWKRYVKGERVVHQTFGSGMIVELSGFGPDMKVTVDFADAGRKKLVVRYAGLEKDYF